MQQFIRGVIRKHFVSSYLANEHDAAVLPIETGAIAFTTDTYVVRPLFFPGGDIGKLAVFGTINDLAMVGAIPQYLSVGMILEEGFSIETVNCVVDSIQKATIECGVEVVTGDTKVVERGKGDGIFLNTAGVGIIKHRLAIEPASLVEGDALIVSGDLGRHGIAVMAAREGLEFETTIQSDCAPLAAMVQDLLKYGIHLHCLRDLTRGGLASALNEIAISAQCSIVVEEERIPIQSEVRGACEMLGIDPLYIANEGRMIAFVPQAQALRAAEVMQKHEVGRGASWIGKVVGTDIKGSNGHVAIKSRVGILRTLDFLSGDQLPRIC